MGNLPGVFGHLPTLHPRPISSQAYDLINKSGKYSLQQILTGISLPLVGKRLPNSPSPPVPSPPGRSELETFDFNRLSSRKGVEQRFFPAWHKGCL